MNRSISVVVPVYRSGPGLESLYGRLSTALDAIAGEWEIILVDDASGDGTYDIMCALHERDPRVRLVRFARNTGQHHATLCGLVRARGDLVFTLDDDLQNPPEEMPKFLAKIDEGFDLVIGRIEGGKKHGWYRNLSSRMLQRLIERILGKPRHIALSSYRCMTRRAAARMGAFTGAHVYLPALMFNSVPPERIANVPVEHHAREYGRSTYTLAKLLRLASYLLVNHSSMPLRIMAVWGLLVSTVSLGFAAYVAVDVLVNGSRVTGWPSIAVLVSFLSGNIMLCTGILGEYVGRLVEEGARTSPFPVFEERP